MKKSIKLMIIQGTILIFGLIAGRCMPQWEDVGEYGKHLSFIIIIFLLILIWNSDKIIFTQIQQS